MLFSLTTFAQSYDGWKTSNTVNVDTYNPSSPNSSDDVLINPNSPNEVDDPMNVPVNNVPLSIFIVLLIILYVFIKIKVINHKNTN